MCSFKETCCLCKKKNNDNFNNALLAIKNNHVDCLKRALNNIEYMLDGDIENLFEHSYDHYETFKYLFENPPLNYYVSIDILINVILHGNIKNTELVIKHHNTIVRDNFDTILRSFFSPFDGKNTDLNDFKLNRFKLLCDHLSLYDKSSKWERQFLLNIVVHSGSIKCLRYLIHKYIYTNKTVFSEKTENIQCLILLDRANIKIKYPKILRKNNKCVLTFLCSIKYKIINRDIIEKILILSNMRI